MGTLQSNSECHLHISLADKEGKLVGGHLVGECVVFTTAEVVIGALEGIVFEREFDAETGFKELVVKCE